MKIAVIGSGAIGALVAGYFKLKGKDVLLIGRPEAVLSIKKEGLRISGVRGSFKVDIPAEERLSFAPDIAILATKTQDLGAALENNLVFLKSSVIVTTQNGVRADRIAAGYLPKENIISSIVMFGSTYLSPQEVVHNFEGSWVVGDPFGAGADNKIPPVISLLAEVFPAVKSEDILGMKYLKIFVNANNCLPAILGLSMQEAFADLEVSRISINILREGLEVVSKAKIKLSSLPGFPVENLTRLTSIPSGEAAKVYSGIMAGLSREPLYGSILQSIKRSRASEIDYINGEFLRLAKENNLSAMLNGKLVQMVHEVEATGRFFSKDELLENVREFLS